MSFRGWPEEALDFYDGLEPGNTKIYWTAHKAVYDMAVLGPMTELTEELAPDFGDVKIFRPNRDIRFSKDKWTRRAQDRSARLSSRPPADRATALQGPGGVEAVAGRAVARHPGRERPCG